MLAIFLTFVITTTGYGFLFWLAWRRVIRHIQGNPDAARAVVEHVFIPVFGKTKPEEERKET